MKKKSGLRFIGSGRFEGKDWNGVPTPFSRPPPSPAEVLFRDTDYAGPFWRELTIMKDRDGCLKKADYLGAQVLIKDG